MLFIKLLFLTLTIFLTNVHGEIFSSLVTMKNLVSLQGNMLENFKVYLKTQEESINQITKIIVSIKNEYEMGKTNPLEYISNPINSYRLIKQLHIDWNYIQKMMIRAYTEFNESLDNVMNETKYPDESDFVGSVEAILRIQDIYGLKSGDMSNGILNNVQYSSPLSSNDCVEIGIQAYDLGEFNRSQEWLKVALEKYQIGENNVEKIDILNFMASNEYHLGKYESSLKKYAMMYLLDPTFPEVKENMRFLEDLLRNKTFPELNADTNRVTNYGNPPGYNELCRETLDRPHSIKKRLSCRYLRTSKPYSKLAPFKIEEQYLQPYVAVYHDVLFDSEIEYLLKEIQPMLKRAEVYQEKNKTSPDKVRISMNSALENDHSPIVKRITRRFEDMTGLTMEFAEILQIANYGIGGHYASHFDAGSSLAEEYEGDRIATILIYMTDVEQGGNTIFPYLGISVKPKKGSAVFWYNLHLSGEANDGTLHSACPVIKGNKWVLNKWVRLRGNEVERPCSLQYQPPGNCSVYPKLKEVKSQSSGKSINMKMKTEL